MEEHGVVPDVIDTAPTDELEVSVMNIHCTLNDTVDCLSFYSADGSILVFLNVDDPPPELIIPLSCVA